MRASILHRVSGAAAILTTAVLLAACAPPSAEPSEAPAAPETSAAPASVEPRASEAVDDDVTAAPDPTGASVTPRIERDDADGAAAAPVVDHGAGGPDEHGTSDEQGPPERDAVGDAPEVVVPVGPGPFRTQNGSATFTVPEGWAGFDASSVGAGTESGDAWMNMIELERGGVRVRYVDTLQVGPLATARPGEWGAVDARPLTGSLVAQSFWTLEDGRYAPHVALTSVSERAAHGFPEGMLTVPVFAAEGDNSYRFEAELSDASGHRASFGTEEEAVEFLQSAPVAAALELIASVELTGVDGRTLP